MEFAQLTCFVVQLLWTWRKQVKGFLIEFVVRETYVVVLHTR